MANLPVKNNDIDLVAEVTLAINDVCGGGLIPLR